MGTSTGLNESSLPLLRLLQLVSPSLPVGAFAYSEGIEWAVESGWIRTERELEHWLQSQLRNALAGLDLPVLSRLYESARADDIESFKRWSAFLAASRETAELRAEEANRGRALADLLVALEVPGARAWRETLRSSQLAGFAFASVRWAIPAEQAALGYVAGWLENLVLAAVKIMPLGQTTGQRILHRLLETVPDIVGDSRQVPDQAIGTCTPGLAIASSLHETQYTRLFRS